MSDLTDLLERTAIDLRDIPHTTWSTDELTGHLRRALHELGLVAPEKAVLTVTPSAGSRELSVVSLGDIVSITDIWYPYDAEEPAYPASRPAWRWLASHTIELLIDEPPNGSLPARIFYERRRTIDGLDGDTATTLDDYQEQLLVLGATAFAAEQLALVRTGAVTVAETTPEQLAAWARQRRQAFESGLARLAARSRSSMDPRLTWNEEG